MSEKLNFRNIKKNICWMAKNTILNNLYCHVTSVRESFGQNKPAVILSHHGKLSVLIYRSVTNYCQKKYFFLMYNKHWSANYSVLCVIKERGGFFSYHWF